MTLPLAGSNDWTALEVSARVAEHGGMVQPGQAGGHGQIISRGAGRLILTSRRPWSGACQQPVAGILKPG
jgi:hypothetical protein